jgi:crossover junction endodeoxyribonuclease RuvC
MQDIEIVVEAVHAMPKQGVSSSFKFGMAYGAALALAERFHAPWGTVTPQKWKKYMKLTSNKNDSLEMARNLWPNAPLHLKKHDGRAEALLMAEWLRTQNI